MLPTEGQRQGTQQISHWDNASGKPVEQSLYSTERKNGQPGILYSAKVDFKMKIRKK